MLFRSFLEANRFSLFFVRYGLGLNASELTAANKFLGNMVSLTAVICFVLIFYSAENVFSNNLALLPGGIRQVNLL